MIKAILFDFGGVVEPYYDKNLYARAAKKLGVSYTAFANAHRKVQNPFERGVISNKEYWRRMLARLHKKESPLKYCRLWETFFLKAKPRSYMLTLIRKLRLKKYTLCVLSNVYKPVADVHKKRGHYNLFQKRILSCDVKARKPCKAIYRIALKKTGLKPRECLFIDNMPINVAAARELGIPSIRFKDANKLRKDLRKRGIIF